MTIVPLLLMSVTTDNNQMSRESPLKELMNRLSNLIEHFEVKGLGVETISYNGKLININQLR